MALSRPDLSGTTILNGNVGIGTTSIISGMKLDCRGSIDTHGITIGDINTITANRNNVQVPGHFQLLVSPPTATNGASIQTLKQGTGSNQDLILQGSGGRVCIGNNGPFNGYGIFDIGGDNNTTYYSKQQQDRVDLVLIQVIILIQGVHWKLKVVHVFTIVVH
jgi:hypothetical protein